MDNIKERVDDLPEIYQNIYGHPEYDNDSSRHCEEREALLRKIISDYQAYSGKREIRVLDLGCAQGYYSFCCADSGAVVDGIDFLDKNVACCKALQEENGLPCQFKEDKITLKMVDDIKDDSYDVILFFSVIHHICHENGFDYARTLMEHLANKGTLILTELALKEEPLYWNDNLPGKYDEWFRNVAFFDEQKFFPTHLSDIQRPFITVSNHLYYSDGVFYRIDEYKKSAYEGKPEDLTRRYYLCDGNKILIKQFRDAEEAFMNEIETEASFLKENGDLSFVPQLVSYKKRDSVAEEITEIKYGKLLRQMIMDHEQIDFDPIFEGVLDNCIELEKRGYYHGDLRAWNVCVDDEGKGFLIDFGNISKSKEDSVMEMFYREKSSELTVYDAFVAMLYDVLCQNRYASISLYGFYEPTLYYDFDKISDTYANFIQLYFLMEKPTFKKLHDMYQCVVLNGEVKALSDKENQYILERQIKRLRLMAAKDVDLSVLEKQFKRSHEDVINRLEETKREQERLQSQIDDCEIERGIVSADNEQLQGTVEVLRGQLETMTSELNMVRAELDLTRAELKEVRQWMIFMAYMRVKRWILWGYNRFCRKEEVKYPKMEKWKVMTKEEKLVGRVKVRTATFQINGDAVLAEEIREKML